MTADSLATPTTGWYVINLDRSPERLRRLRGTLDVLGIAVERVPAVDGENLALPHPGIDAALYRRTHGRDLSPGEAGCYLSHLRALEAFLASAHDFGVILEDDAAVDGRARDLVAALTAPMAPHDWDLVKLESHHRSPGLTIRRLGDFRLCALPFRSAGSAAYLVGRRGAAEMLAGLLPMRLPYDVAFDRGWDFGLRVRSVLPSPITAGGAGSTIDVGRAGTARKAPPLGFRAATKAMRFVSALHAWCAPTRALPRLGANRRSDDGPADQQAGTAL